jgi:hypothetical protein
LPGLRRQFEAGEKAGRRPPAFTRISDAQLAFLRTHLSAVTPTAATT